MPEKTTKTGDRLFTANRVALDRADSIPRDCQGKANAANVHRTINEQNTWRFHRFRHEFLTLPAASSSSASALQRERERKCVISPEARAGSRERAPRTPPQTMEYAERTPLACTGSETRPFSLLGVHSDDSSALERIGRVQFAQSSEFTEQQLLHFVIYVMKISTKQEHT